MCIEQGVLFQDISVALIGCTPEHWYSAVLFLNKSDTGLVHTIESDEGHSDIVSPSDELFIATRKLQLLLSSKGEMFLTAKFRVWLNDSEQWQFKSEFTYEST